MASEDTLKKHPMCNFKFPQQSSGKFRNIIITFIATLINHLLLLQLSVLLRSLSFCSQYEVDVRLHQRVSLAFYLTNRKIRSMLSRIKCKQPHKIRRKDFVLLQGTHKRHRKMGTFYGRLVVVYLPSYQQQSLFFSSCFIFLKMSVSSIQI